jgi:hypothetical protein
VSQFRNVTRLVWSASVFDMVVALGLGLLAGLMPPVIVWLTRSLVDATVVGQPAVGSGWLVLAMGLGVAFGAQRLFQSIQASNVREFAEKVSRRADRTWRTWTTVSGTTRRAAPPGRCRPGRRTWSTACSSWKQRW